MIGESVVIVTPTVTVDRYGNDVVDWGGAGERTVTGAAFDPGTMSEDNVGRTAVTATPTVYLPAGTSVASTCRVRVRGVDYDAVGGGADWRNPFTGARPGVAVSLSRVDG